MKKILILIVLLIAVSCTNAQKSEFSKEALSASLVSSNKSLITFNDILKSHTDKIILIEIWASWCGDCVKAMPKIHELQAQNPEVDYLFISMDKSTDNWKKAIVKYELKGEHFMATDQMKGIFGKSIDLDWIPRYIIIDKTGKIVVYRAIETDFDLMNNTLQELKKNNKQ
jgi:thiol-disulfide isomerase/thioredoxin